MGTFNVTVPTSGMTIHTPESFVHVWQTLPYYDWNIEYWNSVNTLRTNGYPWPVIPGGYNTPGATAQIGATFTGYVNVPDNGHPYAYPVLVPHITLDAAIQVSGPHLLTVVRFPYIVEIVDPDFTTGLGTDSPFHSLWMLRFPDDPGGGFNYAGDPGTPIPITASAYPLEDSTPPGGWYYPSYYRGQTKFFQGHLYPTALPEMGWSDLAPGTLTDFTFKLHISSVSIDWTFTYDDAVGVASGTAQPRVQADRFGDITVCSWCGDVVGTVRHLSVGINRNLLANVGTGSGSTGGWETYLYGDVDADSGLGMCFLPNGKLLMTFKRGGSQLYTINHKFGMASGWDAPQILTPGIEAMFGTCIAQGQTAALRTL